MLFRSHHSCAWVGAASVLLVATLVVVPGAWPRKSKLPRALTEILSRMDESAKRLKTLSANLEYTKVTVVVDDKSTEAGRMFFRKGKSPQILINIEKPDPKFILFKKNKAEIFYPKINQIQEYDLAEQSGLVQQFLLLGFGTETGELKKSYDLTLLGEEEMEGEFTALLELTPRKESLAAQLLKVQLWVSEESWLPIQQKFFQPGGDYLIAHYTSVKVNRELPGAAFQIPGAKSAKRVEIR